MVVKFRISHVVKYIAVLLVVFGAANRCYATVTAIASKEYVDSAITNVTEVVSNKVKSVAGGGPGLTGAVTDDQYPSAKVTYDELSIRMDKVPAATSGNIATFDSNGQVVDSTQAPSNFQSVVNRLSAYLETPTADQYYNAAAVNAIAATKVGLTGDETIEGTKTFSAIPLIPTATLPSP